MATTRTFVSEALSGLDDLARKWVAAGSPAVDPRTAATVLLVRDGASGPEVFLQQRASTMAFAPRMAVFPGGRVDPADAAVAIGDGVVRPLADGFGIAPDQASAVLAAATREVEEECGVRLEPGDLRPRARWITPAFEPRRYDTFFFAARLPEGQTAVGTTSETVTDVWGRAGDLLAAGEAGTLRLMPPTIVNLEHLAAFDTVEAFLRDTPPLDVVLPTLVEGPDGWRMETRLP